MRLSTIVSLRSRLCVDPNRQRAPVVVASVAENERMCHFPSGKGTWWEVGGVR